MGTIVVVALSIGAGNEAIAGQAVSISPEANGPPCCQLRTETALHRVLATMSKRQARGSAKLLPTLRVAEECENVGPAGQ